MDGRTSIVPSDSPLLAEPGTQRLHTYPDGSVLIQTTAPMSESGTADETPVRRGLQLPEAAHQLEPIGIRPLSVASATVESAERSSDQQTIMAYVALIGPVDTSWLSALRDLDVVPLHYQPEHTYLCRSTAQGFAAAKNLSFVLSITPLTAELKPQINVFAEDGDSAIDVLVVLYATPDETAHLVATLRTVPGVTVDDSAVVEHVAAYLRVPATVTPEGQEALLHLPLVAAVERREDAQPEDEVANLIIAGQYSPAGAPNGSYMRWLTDHGLSGAGVTIGIVDNGVDVSHPAFSGRISDLGAGRKSWHGTFVAGHAAGCYMDEKDSQQFVYGVGVAPAAAVLVQDNSGAPADLCRQTVATPGTTGAVGSVQNNSWGKGLRNPMDYSSEEAIYDRMARNADPNGPTPRPLTICFSSGNSGSAGLTRPKAAKNSIVTGNSESYRPDVGRDQSDNIRTIYSGPHGSSWGNCGDGRIRPHVVAPGEWTASANYDSHPGEPEYISPRLTWGGGSSAASPKTAGVCALLIEWWRKHNHGQDPSPALLRALIVNGAQPIDSGGFIPNNQQGWGRLDIDAIVSEGAHVYDDQSHMLTHFGDQQSWTIRVADPRQPVKITLAWTDPPGPVGSGGTANNSPIVNKLALRVEGGGKLYRGNQFQNGWSVADGPADAEGSDNLQNVYLAPGALPTTLRVTVTALNITTDCLSAVADTPRQDFALVVTNGSSDAATTPADIVVAVDSGARNEPPSQPDGYWKDGSGDTGEFGPLPTAPTSAPADPATPPAAPSYDWWFDTATPFQWSQAETERAVDRSPFADDVAMARAMRAGIDVAAISAGGRIVPLAAAAEATERDDTAPVDLSATLAHLMSVWDTFGASERSETRRRAAVIVVSAGTRVSNADIAALRRLTFLGNLYLVSDAPALLAFLAQRVHRQQGFHIRLAVGEDLRQLVRDTMAEAGGAQRVGLVATNASGQPPAYAFLIVNSDRHLTIRVTEGRDIPAVSLVRPDGSEVALSAEHPADDGVAVLRRAGLIQIDIDSPAAGQWALRMNQTTNAAPPSVNVWCIGGPQFALYEQERIAAESATGDESTLLVLNGEPGGALSHAVLAAPRIAASYPMPNSEDQRDIVMRAATSRLGRVAAPRAEAEDSRDPPTAERLSQWVPTPHASAGATVLDIPLHVVGVDADGHRFARMVRANLFRLEPRSDWKQRIDQRNALALVTAQVAEVRYAAGEVVALLLRNGERQRDVHVGAPALRALLSRLDLDDLRSADLRFGVVGSDLLGIVRAHAQG